VAGGVGIYLAVILQLPACGYPRAGLFNSKCHTTVSVALCLCVLLVLCLIYIRFFELVSRIANIPRSNYGVVEDKTDEAAYYDTEDR
jgi:hypothetical protein